MPSAGASQVDPRARGGASPRRTAWPPWTGRSPRTRGSLRLAVRRRMTQGSIPAHAGEPQSMPRQAVPLGVDPRARGGARPPAPRAWPAEGRSPRTRGSRHARGAGGLRAGSIPAHAGEPICHIASRGMPRVDPRARGGAIPDNAERWRFAGRSPRTRGSPIGRREQQHLGGSIPAHAGEPRLIIPRCPPRRVDPRARGGAAAVPAWNPPGAGRSPRTRGSRRKLPQIAAR